MSPGSNNGSNNGSSNEDTESDLSSVGADDFEAVDDATDLLAPSTPTRRRGVNSNNIDQQASVDSSSIDQLATELSSVGVSLKNDDANNVTGQEILIKSAKMGDKRDDDDDDDVSVEDRKKPSRGRGASEADSEDGDVESSYGFSDEDNGSSYSSDEENIVSSKKSKGKKKRKKDSAATRKAKKKAVCHYLFCLYLFPFESLSPKTICIILYSFLLTSSPKGGTLMT